MSKINVNTWEPESGTAMTLGASGDTVTVPDGAILAVASGGDINVASGGEIDIASGATLDVNGTIDLTGATTTGFPAGGFTSVTVYTVTPGSNWSRPTGVTKVIVECQGAGGGGANHGSDQSSSGGGGGGGYACKFIDVSSVTEAVITVGVAGAGGGVGGTGTETKWLDTGYGGSSTVIGGGGTGHPKTSHATAAGGTASGGDFHMVGQNGYGEKAKKAGSSQLGRGGQNILHSETPALSPGVGYGGGGGGKTGSAASPGSAGIMIVWEYK